MDDFEKITLGDCAEKNKKTERNMSWRMERLKVLFLARRAQKKDMYHFNKLYGFFALTNKLTGETKMIRMDFDWDMADGILRKAERIYKAIESKKEPDAVEDISMCEGCKLAHICGIHRGIEPDIELDDELNDLIKQKYNLKKYVDQYGEVGSAIKSKVGEREKVITGDYLVQRKCIQKKSYKVPERTEYRLQIQKL